MRADEAGLERIGESNALSNRAESKKLFTPQPQIENRIVNPMRCNPGGPRTQSRKLDGRRVLIFMTDACLSRLAFFALVQAEHDIVGGILEGDQDQVGLQSKARTGIERRDLVDRQGRTFPVIESLDKGPFNARNIHGETVAAACGKWVREKPVGEFGAEITQRERAAGIRLEIGDGEGFKGA